VGVVEALKFCPTIEIPVNPPFGGSSARRFDGRKIANVARARNLIRLCMVVHPFGDISTSR
jgi:hypothetical protein